MKLKVDIITPEKLALTDEVDFISAPAFDGEIGILPGHTPLLTRLGPGPLRLKKGDVTITMALSGGYLQVQDGVQVEIYATTAEMAEDIDQERAKLAVERAKKDLTVSTKLNDDELAKVVGALARAEVRLKVARLKRSAKGMAE